MSENETFDFAEFCQMQNSVCEQAFADAERRRAEAASARSVAAVRECAEELDRAARALADADVQVAHASHAKHRAALDFLAATAARCDARDRYNRAVAAAAWQPSTSAPEKETPQP